MRVLLRAVCLVSGLAGPLVACAATAPSAPPPSTTEDVARRPAEPATATTAPDDAWLIDYAALLQADERAARAASEERWLDATAHLERGADFARRVPSPTGRDLNFDAARLAVRGGDIERAEANLILAVQRGYRHVRRLASHVDLDALRARPAYPGLLRQAQKNAERYNDAHADLDAVQLDFSDIDRFWAAYDLAQTMPSFVAQTKVFRDLYLAPASPGLLDYHRIKTKSIEALVENIRAHPGYYAGIRATTLKAESYGSQIRSGLKRLKALYPRATFPDVTFVIGRLNSGGTAGESGMLIGVDIWSWTPGVSVEGLSSGMQTLLKTSRLDVLPHVVLHEHVHALQSFGKEETLLEMALAEGSADFIAHLALPEREHAYYYEWGLAHERAVRERFVREMNDTQTDAWIANMSTATAEWSGDLGYFIGARICEAYYAQADDKQKAIEDILFVNDAPAFLRQSGYLAQPVGAP